MPRQYKCVKSVAESAEPQSSILLTRKHEIAAQEKPATSTSGTLLAPSAAPCAMMTSSQHDLPTARFPLLLPILLVLVLLVRPAAAAACAGGTFTTTAAADAALSGCTSLTTNLVLNLDAAEPDLAVTGITSYVVPPS